MQPEFNKVFRSDGATLGSSAQLKLGIVVWDLFAEANISAMYCFLSFGAYVV